MKLSTNFLSTLLVVLLSNPSGLLISDVAAHGAMESPQELARRAEFVAAGRRSIEKCAQKLRTRERVEQRMRKRNALVDEFVEKKKRAGIEVSLNPALTKRQFSDVDLESMFPATPQCVLAPELTIGPYYAPNQLIRSDMSEDIDGVPFLVAMEMIDINTCEPVPNVMVDFWHCSNIGKYSAFAVEGTTGETFNRGLQQTGSDGIVSIQTIFPGWYSGRATHIHIAAHIGGTISSDGDYYSGGTNPHIGQLFFPEDILNAIDENEHYAANTNTRTLNAQDGIYNQHAASGLDPEMEIHYIDSKNMGAGLVGTIVVGFDSTKNYSLTMGTGGTGGGPGGAPPQGTQPTDSNFTAPGNLTGNSTIDGTAPPASTTGSGAVANIFSVQNLSVTSFLSVVIGLYLFNM